MLMYDIPPFKERASGLYLPPSDNLPGCFGIAHLLKVEKRD